MMTPTIESGSRSARANEVGVRFAEDPRVGTSSSIALATDPEADLAQQPTSYPEPPGFRMASLTGRLA
jgi:hypothetical protein